ncbi:MAG: hypothetical protein VCC04_03900 [Myxococcota bacterium]
MSIVKAVIMAVLAMPLVFGLMSCGGPEEPPQGGAAPKAAAQEKTESTKPASEQPRKTSEQSPKAPAKSFTIAEQLRVEVPVPDDYPADAPIYPGSQASSVRTQGNNIILGFGAMDPPAEVEGYIETDLRNEGWALQSTQEMPNGVLITGNKDGRKISVLIAGVNGNSSDATTLIMVSTER